jgi:2-polyprenyl-3-methyl-5-hydroxy-6-metoxy-1,4-benzoquinol methylase
MLECDFCGNAEGQNFATLAEFSLVRCRNCGLIRTEPRLSDDQLAALYNDPSYYTEYSAAAWDKEWDRNHHLELARIEYFAQSTGRNLLEIGCGGGAFLRCATQRNWNAIGQEISIAAGKKVADQGITVHVGPLENLPLKEESIDVVAMFHVLEHVASPKEFLFSAVRYLKPGGLLVIGIPIINSIDLKQDPILYKRTLHLPFHLHHFTKRTLLRYLYALKLQPLMIDGGIADTISHYLRRSMLIAKTPLDRQETDFSEISYMPKPFWKKLLRQAVSKIFPYPYLIVYVLKPVTKVQN